MIITKSHRTAELIHHDHLLIPVITRFGIQFGFGDKTVEEVCNENNIDINFFLAIVNAFHDNDYFSSNELNNFSLRLIVNYLLKSHKQYSDIKIPRIEALIEELIWDENNETNKSLIKNFFSQYTNEVLEHTLFEEKNIYPYIIEIEDAYKSGNISDELANKIKENTILGYGDEHTDIDSKLLDLKNILIKYLPSPNNENILSNLIAEIFRFENDLKDHTKIEDKVLVPRVTELEKVLLKKIIK